MTQSAADTNPYRFAGNSPQNTLGGEPGKAPASQAPWFMPSSSSKFWDVMEWSGGPLHVVGLGMNWVASHTYDKAGDWLSSNVSPWIGWIPYFIGQVQHAGAGIIDAPGSAAKLERTSVGVMERYGFWAGAGYFAGSLTGLTSLYESYEGWDYGSESPLTGFDRGARFSVGVGQVSGTAAGIITGITRAGASFRGRGAVTAEVVQPGTRGVLVGEGSQIFRHPITGETFATVNDMISAFRSQQRVNRGMLLENSGIVRTANKSRVFFEGMEVRAVRNLSHINNGTLRQMAQDGFAAKDINGKPLILHHLAQDAAGPMVEMPGFRHSVHNRIQHPFGNAPGMGLTPQQRLLSDAWRIRYWKVRALEELTQRGVTP